MIVVNASGQGAIAEHPERVFAGHGMIDDFIRQSGGDIECGSESGRGTWVKLVLPRAPVVAPSSAEDRGEGGDGVVPVCCCSPSRFTGPIRRR